MSPVIVSIGAFEIRWYSVLMLVATVSAAVATTSFALLAVLTA